LGTFKKLIDEDAYKVRCVFYIKSGLNNIGLLIIGIIIQASVVAGLGNLGSTEQGLVLLLQELDTLKLFLDILTHSVNDMKIECFKALSCLLGVR
jgi:hypothetical protein